MGKGKERRMGKERRIGKGRERRMGKERRMGIRNKAMMKDVKRR